MEFKLSVVCTYILDITYHNISNKPLIIYLHTICNILHSITSIYLCLKCLISYSMQSNFRTQSLNVNNFIIYKLQISLLLSTVIELFHKMCSLFFFGSECKSFLMNLYFFFDQHVTTNIECKFHY